MLDDLTPFIVHVGLDSGCNIFQTNVVAARFLQRIQVCMLIFPDSCPRYRVGILKVQPRPSWLGF